MRIHKISLIAALALGSLVAFASLASAQDAPKGKKGRGQNIERMMERYSTDLKLTDDQKPKVKELLENVMKKRQELRDVPADQRTEKARALREDQDKKMKEILKADQFDKYKELQKEMNQRRKGGGPNASSAEGAAKKSTENKAQ